MQTKNKSVEMSVEEKRAMNLIAYDMLLDALKIREKEEPGYDDHFESEDSCMFSV